MSRWHAVSALSLAMVIAPWAASAQSRPCSVDSAATARVAGTNTYRDCDVDRPAKLRNAPKPDYTGRPTVDCMFAKLEFVVDINGVPDSTTALILDTNDRNFAASLVRSLPRWHYTPAQLKGENVRQVVWERQTEAVLKKLRFTVERIDGPGRSTPVQLPPSALPSSTDSSCR